MAATKSLSKESTSVGECRRCDTFCDKLIEPRSCLEMRCGYLYSWVEESTATRYMGCMRKVFRGEIDIDIFEAMERFGGYGGIKMTGRPLPRCEYKVEPARQGPGANHECVNPSFFDADAQAAAFDLRDLAT